TNPIALRLASDLLELGADLSRISEEVFQRKPLAAMRLLGFLLEGMQLDCGNRLAWSTLTAQDFENTGARDEDTEGFANELLAVATVQIAAVIREHRAGSIRVSIRSRGEYDVSQVARTFGGGGHKNAAGCSFNAQPEEVVRMLVPAMKECLGSC
ncbi:MAG TPA: DHHA1 domain-containing protein, partial [Fimbriimonadaceae bacterium]|nr:DHHA1 domain-containing protein [Fimbriimonadaceae bacterium]